MNIRMDSAQHILKSYFGYDTFRPLQAEIINHLLQRKDALVLMPTGGGKSLCFQIPALMLPGTAIVVSPLISLMKDQVEGLKANGVAAEALNSANEMAENDTVRQRLERGEVKLLYMSPERFLTEALWLKERVPISLFAIDEAHCISQWGHDFRQEYTQLSILHEQFPNVPIVALTATADKLTKTDIVTQLRLRDPQIFVSSFDRPNLSLDVRRGYSAKDKLRLLLSLIARHAGESGIVYCLSRKTTESVAEKLQANGIRAGVYHAGLSNKERNEVQEAFTNDRIDVVVATIAFGMGIDKSNVRFIVHYNLPKSIESFYQEIGRGGRDGLPAETVLFYNVQDLITLRRFAEESGQKDINREKLKRMQEYAEAQVCRRRILLNYFGETSAKDCGNCDVCRTPPQHFDGTILAQKALSAIMRTQEQVGFTLLIDILRGSQNAEIVSKGFHLLKTFGAGRDIPFRDWQDYLLQMLQMGFIEIAYNEDNHLKVTPLGKDVLFGRRTAQLAVISREDLRVKKQRKKVAAEISTNAPSSESAELFEQLRQLRLEIAKENHWPAYIVLSDKSLHALAANRPTTLAAFGSTFGIGEHKRDTFGERFLAVIKPFAENSTEEKETEIPAENLKESHYHQQKKEYANAYTAWAEEDDIRLRGLYKQGFSVEQLMEIFERNRNAIISRLKKLGLR